MDQGQDAIELNCFPRGEEEKESVMEDKIVLEVWKISRKYLLGKEAE